MKVTNMYDIILFPLSLLFCKVEKRFCSSFDIVFVLIQNALIKTVSQQQATMQSMTNFSLQAQELVLIVPRNCQVFQDPFHEIFQLFGNYNQIIKSLQSLVYLLQIEKTCLHNVNVVLKPFVACYSPDPDDPRSGRTSTLLYADLHKHIVDRSKKSWEVIQNLSITPYVTFWLKAIWSQHYIKNPELNLKFKMVKIEWNNIPVSSYEVVCWQDDILGMIAEYRCAEFLCDQWLKYWILKCLKNAAYQQMLQYMIDHVTAAINKISKSNNQK